MKQSWDKKFRNRLKKTLHRLRRKEHDNDFDELPLSYKLVSLTLINLGGKKRKGVAAPPVHGNALYYVIDYDSEVILLHPTLLKIYKVSRRAFDKGVTDVWWPNVAAIHDPCAKNRYGLFCNRFSVAETMSNKLKDFAQREKLTKKLQQSIREAIADLKDIPLDQVPKYKIVEKQIGEGLKAWQEKVRSTGYIKRLIVDLKRLENIDEENNLMSSKKDKKKKKDSSSASSAASSSAASSAASSSNDKKKKSSKKGSKSEKKKGEVVVRGKKNAKSIALRYLLKNKGKKVSIDKLCKEIQKVKGRKKEFPPKMILAKQKAVKAFAEKNGLSFKASSSGWLLK
jgi:hypothetical protein